MNSTDPVQSSISNDVQGTRKRKHDGDDIDMVDDATTSADTSLEVKRLIIAAAEGNLDEVKALQESGAADIAFQVA